MIRNKLLALVPVVGLSFALLTLSASPGHGYVSVPPAAFTPAEDGYDYQNLGALILNNDGASDNYYAPVLLPQGATVTKMTLYFYDGSSLDGCTILFRSPLDGSADYMAEVYTHGTSGAGSRFDNTIDYSVVDNSQHIYYLYLNLPASDTFAYGVIIEYTYPVSLPLLVRNFPSGLGGR